MDDEEGRENSLGMYENMERSDIRPDFLGDAKNDDEESGNNVPGSDKVKSALKAGEEAAVKKGTEAVVKKGVEVGLNAATGGTAGTALKAVEQTGATNVASSALLKDGKVGVNIKKFAPLLLIVGIVIIGFGLASVVGQWLFPFAFKSQTMQEWNSTKTSANKRTDALTNNTQLGNPKEASNNADNMEYPVIFSEMGFSGEQIQAFSDAGLSIEEASDGTQSIVFERDDGKKMIVVGDNAIYSSSTGDTLADGESVITDSGIDSVAIAERKQEIADGLQIAASGDDVYAFSYAIKDWKFKERYMIATMGWRGDISGWDNEMTSKVMDRLGTYRNQYSDFVVTGDDTVDKDNFVNLVEEMPAGSTEDTLEQALGDDTLEERVKKLAKNSKTVDCGASSAFTDVESVINGDMTARQVSAGMLWLEAIDKTMAGEGTKAPLSVANNMIVESGSADTPGMHNLFGDTTLDQKNKDLQKVSAQAHGGENGSINMGKLEDAEKYRKCMYEGNTNEYDNEGFISKIGSMFKKVGDWVKNAFSGLAEFFSSLLGSQDNPKSSDVEKALKQTVKDYNKMKDKTYFTGNDSSLLGEALVTSSERIFTEKAKSGSQTTGDTGAVIANYQVQKEVIAEQAEYDRMTKSPFDVTNNNTFLGSIMHNLIPLAVSNKAISLTSTVSGFGSLVSNSLSSLLPTSNAVDVTKLEVSQGDCVLSNSISAVSNAYCNNYYNTDFDLVDKTPVKIFDKVASLRKSSYTYSNTAGKNSPTYGDGPLNEKENDLYPNWKLPAAYGDFTSDTRWKNGTYPHGCENDWKSSTWTEARTASDGSTYTATIVEYDGASPTEWKYNRSANFEYVGFQSGWPNRTGENTTAGAEGAKNDLEPGKCELDLKVDTSNSNQPVINKYGPLNAFLIMSGQRGSEWGVADDANLEFLSKSDFTRGRVHPCVVGATSQCNKYKTDYEWSNNKDEIAESKIMSRFVGGTAFLYYTGNDGSMNVGFSGDKIFKDPTRNDDYFWNEMKWYQAYGELLEWMESAGIVKEADTAQSVARYYEENPIDNSYAGRIARFSGLSKDRVVAVLDLLDYAEFLANYDASELYPTPKPTEEKIEYDNGEVVAQSERVIMATGIIFDELRTRVTTSA